MNNIYLKSGKEESLKRFHPWVFSGAISRIEGNVQEGDLVEVFTSQHDFIARGHYQVGSIMVRVLTFDEHEAIDEHFWQHRLEEAYLKRIAIGIAQRADNNTYRLVHGEGDNLPGLVVDIYGRTAVMQAHSAGMHFQRMEIAQALMKVMNGKIDHIYYKSETTLPYKAELGQENGFLIGGSKENIATERCAVPRRRGGGPEDRLFCRPT